MKETKDGSEYLSERTKLKRLPHKGAYDSETIWKVLDDNWMCTLAYEFKGSTICLPTMYCTYENKIYIHGAAKGRLIRSACASESLCLSIYKINQLVFARSGLHHTVNFDSVTIFGSARLIEDAEHKTRVLREITNTVIPGRWEELRAPLEKEIRRTDVAEISFEEASYKGRTGGPNDEDFDLDNDVWAGTIDVSEVYSNPQPADNLKADTPVSSSVLKLADAGT